MLGLLLSVAFLPMLIKFQLIKSEEAFAMTQKLFIAISLAIYFSILIIPGRGIVQKEEARWMIRFLLVICALLIIISAVFIPFLVHYLRWAESFSDETILLIARLGLFQAIVGILVLLAKSLALMIPYVKKYTHRLSELSVFHRGKYL